MTGKTLITERRQLSKLPMPPSDKRGSRKIKTRLDKVLTGKKEEDGSGMCSPEWSLHPPES